MIRPILEHPDPTLRRRSAPVGTVTDETRALLDDMLETMYAAKGRGLAGVQVGLLQRLVVVDIAWKEGTPAPRAFVDPEIVWSSDTRATREERCLSIPDRPTAVSRPDRVGVRYRDRQGGVREEVFDGLMAMVMQHEIDHLDGVLILDHAGPAADPSPAAAS
jgi:peptide deformylase